MDKCKTCKSNGSCEFQEKYNKAALFFGKTSTTQSPLVLSPHGIDMTNFELKLDCKSYVG